MQPARSAFSKEQRERVQEHLVRLVRGILQDQATSENIKTAVPWCSQRLNEHRYKDTDEAEVGRDFQGLLEKLRAHSQLGVEWPPLRIPLASFRMCVRERGCEQGGRYSGEGVGSAGPARRRPRTRRAHCAALVVLACECWRHAAGDGMRSPGAARSIRCPALCVRRVGASATDVVV